jgi:hypothetical protein
MRATMMPNAVHSAATPQLEEHRSPGRVEHELDEVGEERGAHVDLVASTPDEPRGDGHHEVERRPHGTEDDVGRRPGGLLGIRVPPVDMRHRRERADEADARREQHGPEQYEDRERRMRVLPRMRGRSG